MICLKSGEFYPSAISIMELELGVLRMEHRDASRGAVLRAWLDKHVLPEFNDRVLSIDPAVALRCAQFHTPDPGAERDTLIAATALVHGMTVVTRNIADFRHSGVALLNSWEPQQ